ncbi:MAG TPA: hypothetical protein VGM78_04620 [Ilumatobacteraceae bacterium]
MKRWGIGLVALTLLASCGSSGPDQTIDNFLDKVEAPCRAAHTKIAKLDVNDAKTIATISDTLNTLEQQLSVLHPPSKLKTNFDDLTSNLDDQTTALDSLSAANSKGDADASKKALATVNDLRAKADTLADAMDAEKCVGLTSPESVAGPTTTEAASTTTTTITPPPPTEPPPTEPPTTAPPVTTPPTAAPPPTTPTTDAPVLAEDLSLTATAPPGYTWITQDPTDASGLYAKSNLGPLVTFYSGGRLQNTADGSTAGIYLIKISQDWTANPAALAEYLFWEGVDGGTTELTPGGITVTQKIGAFQDTDCVVAAVAMSGISVCTPTGVDGKPLMDAFLDAQQPPS